MTPYLIGKKLGMTQLFDEAGTVKPATVIEAGPCVITQVKTVAKDGYSAIQIGFGHTKNHTKSVKGHLKAADATSQILKEVTTTEEDSAKVGETLTVSVFENVAKVAVSGVSKGKGFAGVIKRHNFHRGPMSHGSDHHRAPGSIGGMFPQRVLKGQKLPGHMGAQRTTVKNLEVISFDAKNNLLVVKGAVPGPKGTVVEIEGIAS